MYNRSNYLLISIPQATSSPVLQGVSVFAGKHPVRPRSGGHSSVRLSRSRNRLGRLTTLATRQQAVSSRRHALSRHDRRSGWPLAFAARRSPQLRGHRPTGHRDRRGPEKLNDDQRRDVLEIIEDRYERRSTIVTSQGPVGQWYEIIGNPTIADAILDRLVHNAYRIELTGESMRKNRATKTEIQPQA